ncbi:hypothetical protein H310_12434 [Aphanomyces invadans]|uniref:Uncharacterized protein n=1 Tax=Aphanomyces invadans TaxID=157072 RepID=A0A024TJX7_9STRA|nr:hypothetical protein H310_12434 [Aphanomyces invadans]ETV93667.1 hypothetical protein H310_12434 [Aphanomyces invadans]|eukprot:XP_008877708.1 hypothetical protein H310_12434 [Aphanomyces invadans]
MATQPPTLHKRRKTKRRSENINMEAHRTASSTSHSSFRRDCCAVVYNKLGWPRCGENAGRICTHAPWNAWIQVAVPSSILEREKARREASMTFNGMASMIIATHHKSVACTVGSTMFNRVEQEDISGCGIAHIQLRVGSSETRRKEVAITPRRPPVQSVAGWRDCDRRQILCKWSTAQRSRQRELACPRVGHGLKVTCIDQSWFD